MTEFWQEPDWAELRSRLGVIEGQLREADSDAPFHQIAAEALRLLVVNYRELAISAQAAHELAGANGWAARAEERHALEMKALRESHAHEEWEVRRSLAAMLRKASHNPRLVSSHYRAEGVRLAADLVDGGAAVSSVPATGTGDAR